MNPSLSVVLKRLPMSVSRPCDGCGRDIAGMALINAQGNQIRVVLCDDCLRALHDQLRQARFEDRVSIWP